MKKLILPAFMLLQAGAAEATTQYAVVVSKKVAVEQVAPSKIKDLFLKKRRSSDGVRLIPVNIVGSFDSRIAFEQRVLKMDRDAINQYWIKSHFQGLSPPATQASNASLKLFIERVEGAIGYLPLNMVDDNLKVIYEF